MDDVTRPGSMTRETLVDDDVYVGFDERDNLRRKVQRTAGIKSVIN